MTAPLSLLFAALLAAAVLAPEAPVYPDRRNLLLFMDSAGKEQPVRSRRQWEERRRQILLNVQKVMGALPGDEKRVPLDVRVEEEVRTDQFVRRKLSYASEPGDRAPAYLLLPLHRKGRVPAVLCLHQTTNEGKKEPVGQGGKENLHYAAELAERGYVCLVPEYASFGEHQADPYALGWQSGSLKAVWDNMRGIDYLQSLPEVDGKRIGCLGHSLGGHNTLFTAAFDPRIKALVSNCGFTAFGKYYGGDLTGWSGPRYMPRIKTLFPTPERMPFDFHEIIAALAPRPFLALAPLHDSNFEVSGVREVIEAAKPVYGLFNAEERLDALYPDCAHDWPPEMRQKAYAWMDRWLRHPQ